MGGDMTTTGTPLVRPPLVDMISNDPILGGVKVAVTFYVLSIYTH
jgi:isoamylase